VRDKDFHQYPSLLDECATLSDVDSSQLEVKLALALSCQQSYESQCGTLEQVQQCNEYVSSDRLNGVVELRRQLNTFKDMRELSSLAVDQQRQMATLLATYDSLMRRINDQFVVWDAQLRAIEGAKQHQQN
jgi:Dynactin subunit p22